MSSASFEQLLIQLHKKQWKVVTQTVKTKLSLAQQSGDEALVQEILRDFAALKQKVLIEIQPELRQGRVPAEPKLK